MQKKRALVTGGGSGIGLAIANQLSADGHDVVVTGRDKGKLESTGFDFTTMDVSDEASVNTAVESKGPFDIVVSNAGVAKTAPAMKTSLELWSELIAVNMTGTFLVAKATVPHMAENGFGRFIAIASTSSLKAYPYTMAYTSSKHGVLGIVRSLAAEFAKKGVTCNAICPGFTDTAIVQSSIENIVEKTGRTREEAMKAFTKDNPMGRLIAPEEVASSVSWLCQDAANSVNGQSIVIDGGEVIC